MNSKILKISLLLFLGFLKSVLYAQDIEPRFLSAIPTESNFAIASYAYSSGNNLLKNTLPLEDINTPLIVLFLPDF